MISTILVEHPWLSPTALIVLVVAGPVLGRLLVSRPRAAWLLSGVALLPVALLTLTPVDRELFARCTVQWALPTPGRVELMANVVLFVAPVLLAGVATRRPFAILLAASVLSAGIEALQAAVPAIGRSCDTGDWLSNTIGAAIGAALAAVALWAARRPQRHDRPSWRGAAP
ncbi:VanZ family protein [Jiangella endophytica]|uniref:VanZ family protein n=1 Tax=Jiangella endophytica TaxID=1623398 RepID=UPI0013009574|nr:VanZ family protein [Jiangella endophytica]